MPEKHIEISLLKFLKCKEISLLLVPKTTPCHDNGDTERPKSNTDDCALFKGTIFGLQLGCLIVYEMEIVECRGCRVFSLKSNKWAQAPKPIENVLNPIVLISSA